jgi:hypothetical protein
MRTRFLVGGISVAIAAALATSVPTLQTQMAPRTILSKAPRPGLLKLTQ